MYNAIRAVQDLPAKEVNRVREDLEVQEAAEETMVLLDQKEIPASRDRLVLEVKSVHRDKRDQEDLLDYLDLLVAVAKMANLDKRENVVHR